MVITHFLWYNMYVPNTVRGVLIVYMDEDLRAQIIYVNGEYRGNDAVGRLMHAMGPNVAGVIGTAVAAGTMLAMLGAK